MRWNGIQAPARAFPAHAFAARAFPVWTGDEERLRHLLEYAIRAPSRYNAQPWLFEIDGDCLGVFVDSRRALRAADPQGREATLACGAALENVRLGAAHHGHQARVETSGRAAGNGPLARLWLTCRASPEAAEEQLFRAIPLRRSCLRLHAQGLPGELVAALREEAAGAGCALRAVDPSRLPRVAELAAEADAIQWASPRFRVEHAAWTGAARSGASAPATHRPAGLIRHLLQRFGGSARELERRIGVHLGSLLVLSTRGDEPADWVAAGRALERVLLRAASRGLQASYLSQPVEVPEVRYRLRRLLFDAGHPQVLLRFGRGAILRAQARRPVELVLRSAAAPEAAAERVSVAEADAA